MTGKSESGVFSLPVVALSLARFVSQPMAIISGLLLIEIASSFGVSVGVAGQVRTLAAASEMVFALLMGVLTVRFDHKRLLLVGLVFIAVSSIGSTLAPSFVVLMVLYSLTGIGVAIISPMTMTLVGDLFSEERRANIVGLMVATLAASYTVGAPIVSRLAVDGNWRIPMRFYVFPLACLAFLGIIVFVKYDKREMDSGGDYFSGYRVLLSSRSALYCILGAALYMASQVVTLSFGSSYIREVVGASTGVAAVAVILNSFSYIVGSLAAGRVIGWLGSKRTAWMSVLFMTVFYFAAYSLSGLVPVFVLLFFGYFLGGVMYSTTNTLAVGQVSSHRATMMSLFIAVIAMGNVIGNSVAGFGLSLYGYGSLRFVLGFFGVLCTLVNAYLVQTSP